jgi:hypothetical protein
MRLTPWRSCVVILLAQLFVGCASWARRPQSPAIAVRFQDLEYPAPPPGERYYLLVFGSQSTPRLPRYTHTWATVVRVRDHGAGCTPELGHQTISWMPGTLEVRPWSFCVEPGVNLDLHHTIKLMVATGQRVSLWGPYEIWPGLYRKFLIQKNFLECGQVGYQAIDTIGEATMCGNATDCIHAITDADTMFDQARYAVWRCGESASEGIVKQLSESGGFVDPYLTHDWLMPALGLTAYPIIRRCP